MRIGRAADVLALGLVAGLTTVVAPTSGSDASTVAVSRPAADEPSHPLRWLALGDSYSSGEGIDENYGHCAVSPGAYAKVAQGLLDGEGFPIAEQEFLACSGAQVPNVTESVDLVEQIDQASGRYDLITLSIGGNDAGFGDVVFDCIVLVCVDPGEDPEQFEADVNSRIDTVQPSLVDIYGRLIDELLTPGGHIVVLGYPRLFEASSEWPWYIGNGCETFYRTEADMIRGFADRANGMVADAVAEYAGVVHFLDVADAFEGHNLCAGFRTTNEWINGISIGAIGSNRPGRYQHAFHPNRDGHAAEGRILADYIKGLDWSDLATGDMLFDWWMRVEWTPEEIAQGGPLDGNDPVRSLYLGWINGSAVINEGGNITGRAEVDVQPNYPCSGGLIHVTAKQNVFLTGRILPSSSSPLGPDLDLTLRFGPARVNASDEGCTWSEVADIVQPVDLFLAQIDPVHVQVGARLTKDRYGARYDPVPVTIKGQQFVLMIE